MSEAPAREASRTRVRAWERLAALSAPEEEKGLGQREIEG